MPYIVTVEFRVTPEAAPDDLSAEEAAVETVAAALATAQIEVDLGRADALIRHLADYTIRRVD